MAAVDREVTEFLVRHGLSPETRRLIREFLGSSKRSKRLEVYDRRLNLNKPAKLRIAKEVARLISDESQSPTVLLDSGTVTYYVAEELRNLGSRTTLSTNSLTIVGSLAKSGFAGEVHVVPGKRDHEVMALTGPQATRDAREKLTGEQSDIPKHTVAVLGLRAVDHLGIAEDTQSLVGFQRSLFKYADKLVVVAQGEKFAKPATHHLLSLQEHEEILTRRSAEGSIWLVYTEPTAELSVDERKRFERNLERFASRLPVRNVIRAERGVVRRRREGVAAQDAVAKAALDALTLEFDELLASMQSPRARRGMAEAFNATPARLGKAAVAAAKRRG